MPAPAEQVLASPVDDAPEKEKEPLLSGGDDDGISEPGGNPAVVAASALLPDLRTSLQISLPGATTSEQLGRLIPVGVVMLLIFIYYMAFVAQHCMGMITEESVGTLRFWSGVIQLLVFHVLLFAMLYCYFRCLLTPPGVIPQEFTQIDGVDCAEKKHGGDRRYCRWCAKYKPDRAHHCRICRTCVLKMDHHCPWINNCVGFANHKYFILCITYAVVAVNLVALCHFVGQMHEDLFQPMEAVSMAIDFIFGFFSIVLTLFVAFHAYLVIANKTTLEFRERMWNTKDNKSIYDCGAYNNICTVLGKNPWLWFVPIVTTPGDGMHWQTSEDDEGAVEESKFEGFETLSVPGASTIRGSSTASELEQ